MRKRRPVVALMSALMLTSCGLVALAGSANASNSEVCADPSTVYGNYAVSACYAYNSLGQSISYMYVSLQAGYSDCHVHLRAQRNNGELYPGASEPPGSASCPNDGLALVHWDPNPPHILLDALPPQTWRTIASIYRVSDGKTITSYSSWFQVRANG